MDIRISDLREKTLFRTRSGSPARITAVYPDDIYPFLVESFDGTRTWTVREDGFSLDSLDPSPNDLVSRWNSNLVLSQADVGKHFKNREGDVVKIVAFDTGNTQYPVRCRLLKDDSWYYLSTAGRYYYEDPSDNRHDLIEEVPEPLTITEDDIGKKFRTRDGQTVTITAILSTHVSDPWPVRGRTEDGYLLFFKHSGHWLTENSAKDLDLVERLPEPEPTPEPLTITEDDTGKKFRTRDGRIVEINGFSKVQDTPWPVLGCVEGDDFQHSFRVCGSWRDSRYPCRLDLIERLPEPLTITEDDIGKKFRARGGRTVTIVRIEPEDMWPVKGEDEGGDLVSFEYSGHWNDNLNPCELDLVERIPEPTPEGDEEDALFMTLLGLAFLASLSDSGNALSPRN